MTKLAASRFGRVAFALLVLAFAQVTFAQTAGRLAGTVLDTSGGVLPGATVTATNLGTGEVHTDVVSGAGAFVFPNLPVGNYKVTVELTGFKTATFPQVQVNVGQEYSLTARLEVGQIAETVEVTASSPLVQTTTPEVNRTVTQSQVLQLPIVNRDMTNLIRMVPGVPGTATRMNTAINGGRATWTQVSQDGINIQDNFIRTNALDFLPNRPSSDNVGEFTITTSLQGAESAGGATSVRMVTPSGTNTFRGSAFWQLRDNSLAANSFFNNKSGIKKPDLEQNQFGGRLGGPAIKNKLFFFFTYEGFRRTQAGSQNQTIAANPGLFNGEWRYVRTADGQVGSVNILGAVGATVDPKMKTDVFDKIPASTNVNSYDRGDSRADRILNTAGYRWDQTRKTVRNYYVGRADYEMSTSHRFEGIFTYSNDTDDRPDLDFISGPNERPQVFTASPIKRYVGAWRWLASSNFQNEVRYGANLAPVRFEVFENALPTLRFAGQTANLPLTLMDPQITFFPQGRNTNTYQFTDNMNYQWGDHSLQMGGSWQIVKVNPYNYEGVVPTVTWGFSTAAPASAQLTSAMFPGGISAADLSSANTMLSMLTGTVQGVSRQFQVESQTSGYVPGIANNRNYTMNIVAGYLQDNWRWKPNLTIRAGLKWEYYSPVREDDNLGFLPQLTGGQNFKDALLSPNTTISFVDGGMWNSDFNNFGPTIGFAWDPTKNGKTAIRGGYSLTFVPEESITVATNSLAANAGLATTNSLTSLYSKYSTGVPEVPTPTFLPVRTLANQMALNSSAPMGMPDPNLRQPRVHQVSVGVSRELGWSLAGEARYVGTFGRDIWKGVDYNQISIPRAFLEDFNRARSNGFLSSAAGLGFNPDYNPAVAGSQPLTVIPAFGGGFLTNSSVRTNIQQNEVASLADFYTTNRVAGALSAFFPNPGIYESRAVVNDGWQDYNALQLELRRNYKNGFFGTVNYTYAGMRANSTGGGTQSRFEPFLDNARPQLDTGRSAYNIRHIVNANFILDLPFGAGRKWVNGGGLSNVVLGGWQVSGIVNWQSGSPVGIYAQRGTFNRATGSRSNIQTANSSLSVGDIKKLTGVFEQNGIIYWIDPKVINTDGRGVGTDSLANSASYSGQIFFNPAAGEVGTLPILAFDAPAVWNLNMALSKKTRLVGKTNLDLRVEAFNLTNSVCFYAFDYNINSTTFGRITSTANSARVVQLTARFEF